MPLARWQAVPAAPRQATDAAIDAKLAAAHADQTACLTAVQQASDALAVPRPRPALAGPTTSWMARWMTGQAGPQRKVHALAGIDRARRAALEADLAWWQRRVEAATARVAMVEADREFTRATVIDDRSTSYDESLEIPRLRGQLARAQARWFLADAAVAEARGEVVRANQQLAAAKETFAQLVRAESPELPFQLSRWAKAAEVRRRGLKVTERATPLPCRRRTCFRQEPADTVYLTIAEPRARR